MTPTYGLAAWFPEVMSDEDCRLLLVDQMITKFPDAMIIDKGGPHIVDDDYGMFPGWKKVIVAFTSDVNLDVLTQDDDAEYHSFISAAIDRIRRMLGDDKEKP